ncbi:MAG TPA: thiamine pyrophosphate-dependent enzyme, partial [Acidimicrobiales bacterium]|nr:thiamine pyrophosphate-dependent enzyme [Acidimicrobiales bacterium]
IELGPTSASVGSATFAPVSLTAALHALASIVAQVPRGEVRPSPAPTLAAGAEPTTDLTQGSLWGQVTGYLRPGDVVMADQGTSFYGMATARLPSGVTFLGQPLWASIGYSLPGLLGACLAAPGRRGILLVGDGAAQMTVQELSSFLRAGLAPTVIVVDNRGYTVERAIHGPEQAYNDISEWDWTGLPALLAPGTASNSFRVTTNGALSEALACASSDADRLTLVQAVVPRLDTPPLLADLARAAARANAPRGGPLVEDGA